MIIYVTFVLMRIRADACSAYHVLIVSDATSMFTIESWRVYQMQYGDTALACATDNGHADCARLLADDWSARAP